MTKMPGSPGRRKIGLDTDAACPVGCRLQPLRRRRGCDTRRPQGGPGRQELSAEHDSVRTAFGNRLSEPDLDPEAVQRLLGIGREVLGEAGEDARARLDQDDTDTTGVDSAEIAAQRVMRQFGDGAGELDAGRPRSDDHEGEPLRAPLRIDLPFRLLEGREDAAPDARRILQRLHARRIGLPFVMAEIGMAGAGREDQRVEADRPFALQQHLPVRPVDAGNRAEQRGDVLVAAQQEADRPGDLRGRQRSRRDLIEQRLEQMMIALVDHGDPDWRASEVARGFEPAEAGADDDDVMLRPGRHRSCGVSATAASEVSMRKVKLSCR